MSLHWCPYCSSLTNPQLYPTTRPRLAVYGASETDAE